MSGSRTDNAIKNTVYGFINRCINILMPFVTRTVIVYFLSMEYAGLSSLFTSVVQVLNLAELGISSAVTYCMYKPMAENDTDTLCAIASYMRKLYYIIGMIVGVIGIAIIPFLPVFVHDNIPDNLNLTILYIIYLLNNVIGYFFFAYKQTILNAAQKVGVLNNINSGIILCQQIVQILTIIIFRNYYLYLIIFPVFTVINNICLSYITKKQYPQIICRGKLSEDVVDDIKKRVKGLFVTRLCTTTRNAFDSIFISSVLGLTTVAIYGNYYYVMAAVISILSVITTSITASVGNSMVTETKEKNYKDMRKFNFVFNWIVGFCTCCLLVMYQPFMELWMGKESLFSMGIVAVICVYFYFLNIGSIRAVYHDAAGLWWEARYRAVLEAVSNLVLNFILTRWLGVLGTIIGTLISLVVINYIYGTQIVFRYYFKTISPKQYFTDNMIYGIITVFGCICVYTIMRFLQLNGITELIVAFAISAVVFNVIYFISVCKMELFQEGKEILGRVFIKFFKR